MVPWWVAIICFFVGGGVGLMTGCLCAISGRESKAEEKRWARMRLDHYVAGACAKENAKTP
jgi:hypothetical protein